MGNQIAGVGRASSVNSAASSGSSQGAGKTGNIDMQPQSDKYIETKNFIDSRMEICAKDPELKKVFDKVDCVIGQDGSVQFNFKDDVNIEQFKKAFAFDDGYFRDYLKARHERLVESGAVHANYTNGNVTDAEQLTDYNLGGLGSRITYTDGYEVKKCYRGGWINRSKIVDCPDYRNMSLGLADNGLLPSFDKSFFNYK